MQVLQNPIFFENGCAAALGTFDGVHLGHQRVISVAVKSGFTPVVVMIMQKSRKKRIFSDELNFSFLEKLGVDTVICLDIDKIRDMTPDEYLEMLYNKMNVRLFACGENHRFGKGASGSYDDAQLLCTAAGAGKRFQPRCAYRRNKDPCSDTNRGNIGSCKRIVLIRSPVAG